MKIFKTECLLNAQLPNTHACSSTAQEFCLNPLFWVVNWEKTCNKLIFSCFASIWPYFSPTKYYVSVNSNWVHPPPGNPGEDFFERANPGHPGKIFCLIPCPGAKNAGRIPGDGAKFSQTRRNCSLSLQKILKKLRKLRDSTTFLFGELKKPYGLDWSRTARKSLNTPALIFN